MKKKRILVDCDGVLSDFVTPTLDLIHKHTGDRHFHNEIVKWNVFESVNKLHIEHILEDAVNKGGYCESLPVLSGSVDAIEKLRTFGDVFIVTAPFDSRNWVYERTRWLERNFGFNKKHIINTASKFVVAGDVLIDDSEKNLQEWLNYNNNGLPLLVDSPWNRHIDHPGIHRVLDWNSIFLKIEEHLNV